MSVPATFKAFRIVDDEDGYRAKVVDQTIEDQSPGDVVIKVAYSSINYKDALAGTGQGKILRRFPLNGGIDAAGEVAHSDHPQFKTGDAVLVTGCGLSETRDGGYSQYLRVNADMVVPLPKGLSLQQSMALGTAGFTAALARYRMEANGQTADQGPIAITGATGGVGSLAVNLMAAGGYQVCAISGKLDDFAWLHQLGASQCISRHELYWPETPLAKSQFAGAIDNVGGDMLSGLTRVIHPWGNIAACGMAGGIGVQTTVMPFIIRGISVLGINSAACPHPLRCELWQRLANEWRPPALDDIIGETVTLDQLQPEFQRLLDGGGHGRTLVKLH